MDGNQAPNGNTANWKFRLSSLQKYRFSKFLAPTIAFLAF